MKTVLIAADTGYLGRQLCTENERRGWHVVARVRDAARAGDLPVDSLVEVRATVSANLRGIMSGVGLVVSALGITRQANGLGYMDVDHRSNVDRLEEAARAGVARFASVHVLNGDKMRQVPLVATKAASAFPALGQYPCATQLPDVLRRIAIALVPVVTPRRIGGPARFFLTAIGMDRAGAPHGTHHLAEHIAGLAQDVAQPRCQI